jgi:hypothetical protein
MAGRASMLLKHRCTLGKSTRSTSRHSYRDTQGQVAMLAMVYSSAPPLSARPWASALVCGAAALFFAGALYAALSAGALPALLERAGQNQIIYFCH